MSFFKMIGEYLPSNMILKSTVICTAYVKCFGFPCVTIGESMSPTLNPDSNSIIVDTLWVRRVKPAEVKAGDVITLNSPTDYQKILIKRVIGMPGDFVSFRNKMVFVPPGKVWIEGDNAYNSYDSRAFGPIPMNLICAKAENIIFPPWRVREITRDLSYVDAKVLSVDSLERQYGMQLSEQDKEEVQRNIGGDYDSDDK